MKQYKAIFLALTSAALLFGCSKDEAALDTEYPTIDISLGDAFPKQCSVLQRGEKYIFKAYLSDNVQLGAVSVDIHHNFDQHTHSTEVNDCSLDPVKKPVKPFLLIQSFPIPAGLKTYQTNAEITVPADVDPGDYHFMIRLTDKEGWQTIKGLSIKIR
ncbi:hypothetical protein ABIE26_004149 [Pedobacter africanus]|uniref:Uncharacterized protein n=1 Tax=Pedobacter africanus TaxID=151894 RepID=A0ACC6L1G7_9SPHI|nr:DUF4625 domain-containing protein [Pedobacter africanus]MDR6785439.1 hypothetical protein [Pedobacter africanus]